VKLHHQLLIINLLSHGILVAALLISHHHMLLTFEQAQVLTGICLLAAILSMLAYWFMTFPIIKSIRNLMLLASQLGQKHFQQVDPSEEGPKEFRDLAKALYQMGTKLEASFQQLEEGERARRELIANVSHDLRTPIATIQSMLEALQDGLIEEEATRERYLTTSLKEVHRLSSLIHDLFDLSKLEGGQEPLQPQLTYLDLILLEVLDVHSIYLQEKQINLHLDVSDTLPSLWVMPTKITRVVSNLLQNAIRHSPVLGKIELIVQLEKDHQVEVIIRDEGEGVAPEVRSRIFERFFRTDHSRNKELGGSGLGLAITKSLVELHHGQIGVRSRQDKKQGSEFWFTLPLKSLDRNMKED
jgi:two-component system sensor histidine kinase SaeS